MAAMLGLEDAKFVKSAHADLTVLQINGTSPIPGSYVFHKRLGELLEAYGGEEAVTEHVQTLFKQFVMATEVAKARRAAETVRIAKAAVRLTKALDALREEGLEPIVWDGYRSSRILVKSRHDLRDKRTGRWTGRTEINAVADAGGIALNWQHTGAVHPNLQRPK